MKIGILTYHAACNFGANLQALSTYEYLKQKGLSPVVIDWTTRELERHYSSSVSANQFQQHKSFREKNLLLSSKCYNEEDIAETIGKEQINAVIIGSDAVLQHHPFLSRIVFPSRKVVSLAHYGPDRMCPNPFWGSFQAKLEHKVPMAFMSASSQNSLYHLMLSKDRAIASRLLNEFSYISVRDGWTQKMVKYISRGKIIPEVTPDPVFAFNYNVINQPSEDLIRKKFNLPNRYILLSFHNSSTVSVEWLNQLKDIAASKGYTCVALPFPNGINFTHPFDNEIPLPLDPLEWYALLKYSDGYVGHNMHPIVVCLHNAVPCFSFDQYGTKYLQFITNNSSSKIYDILEKFSLLDYRVSCNSQLYKAPSPEHVLSKLFSFKKDKVQIVATDLYGQYQNMMVKILESLTCKA